MMGGALRTFPMTGTNHKTSVSMFEQKDVDFCLFLKCYMTAFLSPFSQVVYDTNILYIFAPTADSRLQWVKNLKEEMKNNNHILTKYHPQFWAEGVYQCCRQTDKLAPGCEEYNIFGD
ncbi:hypothetical protein FKM82_031216, partial [Ascaphus truei]